VMGGRRFGMTKTVETPPWRIRGTTVSIMGPSRRWTCMSAAGGRVMVSVDIVVVGDGRNWVCGKG